MLFVVASSVVFFPADLDGFGAYESRTVAYNFFLDLMVK